MSPTGNSVDDDNEKSSSLKKRNFEDGGGERPPKKLKEREEEVDERSSTPSLSSRGSSSEGFETKSNEDSNTTDQLVQSGQSFVQKGYCFKVAPTLEMCRECCLAQMEGTDDDTNSIFCRFIYFRKLRCDKDGELTITGFSDPCGDAAKDDIKMWMPGITPVDLEPEMAKFLISQVGDQFCDLVQQELEASEINMNEDKTIVWKKAVNQVREMCDVCDTTLFNFHWVCKDCGFAVCIDCYKSRKSNTCVLWGGEREEDRDEYYWLQCTDGEAHNQSKLMLTQIIAADALTELGSLMHLARLQWGIESQCGCADSKQSSPEIAAHLNPLFVLPKAGENGEANTNGDSTNGKSSKSSNKESLTWLAGVALPSVEEIKEEDSDNSDSDDNEADFNSEEKSPASSLRSMLFCSTPAQSTPTEKTSSGFGTFTGNVGYVTPEVTSSSNCTLREYNPHIVGPISKNFYKTKSEKSKELKHFVRRKNYRGAGGKQYPIRMMTKGISAQQYPGIPHFYLCEGKLLVLEDPCNEKNIDIFQEQWKRGQPVMVLNVADRLQQDLWHPERFAKDFGSKKANLVNCMSGFMVPNTPLRCFWEGFESYEKRLKDHNGVPMLLKLKDWPPAEDFADILPVHMADLMQALPLGDYTHRTGKLNLAARLPDTFVRPDLGPKMYNAYGSALHPDKGTTNLHLDISDAVNVMVYAGCCIDKDNQEERIAVIKAIDDAGCDLLTKRRVREKGVIPGALWHIFNARDADAIRDLLNAVSVERGQRLEPHHDPIHDQSWYLDGPLRLRLYKDYGVEGYAIAQCQGDAIFVPAGAPHQVRNLQNCIKIAEDFVSPENVSHCFHLTQEFRDLTDSHTNHEDKLQIKNIMYHTVKDSLAVLDAQANSQKSDESETVTIKAQVKEEPTVVSSE